MQMTSILERRSRNHSEPNVLRKTSQEITGVGRISDCDDWCFYCPALHLRRVGLNFDVRRLHNFRHKLVSMRVLKLQFAAIAVKASLEYLIAIWMVLNRCKML